MSGAVSPRFTPRAVRGAGAGLVSLGAALPLAACGSSGAGSRANGVASKPPAQIVAAAQSALRSASGFVVAGTLHARGKSVRLRVSDGGTSKLDVQISESGKRAEIIVLPGAGYVRANEAFLTAQAGAAAAGLANRWIELPAAAIQPLTSGLGTFAPSRLAQCLGEDVGSLSRDGGTTVDGRAAVVIRDAGNVPGSNPGTLAVATHGPAYPLRVTSTGPTRPGGKVEPVTPAGATTWREA